MSDLGPEFWEVVGDICRQGSRHFNTYPDDKVMSAELIRSEIEVLRLAWERWRA